MSFFRGNETVTIRRRVETGTDAYGNATYTTTETQVKYVFLGFQTVSNAEPIDPMRNAVDGQIVLYFPRGTVIEDGDTFIVRNTEWEKDGKSMAWENPFNLPTGVVVPIRKRDG